MEKVRIKLLWLRKLVGCGNDIVVGIISQINVSLYKPYENQIFYIFSCPLVLSSLPLRGPYSITVPVILAYIQSSLGLRHRLSLVADIFRRCRIVVVVFLNRVFLTTSERTYLLGLYISLSLRGQQFSEDV